MSKNELTTFTFNTSAIRVVTIDGNPWFVAADVCRVLGLSTTSGTFMHLKKLDDSEKVKLTPNQIWGKGSGAGIVAITESGLYKLVMRSDSPEAKPFQDWVTQVVLPAIRKDGAYIMGEEKVVTGEMSEDELILKAVSILQTKVQRLTEEKKELEIKNQSMSKVLGKHDHTLARFVRTITGVNSMQTKKDLDRLGYLYKQGGNLPGLPEVLPPIRRAVQRGLRNHRHLPHRAGEGGADQPEHPWPADPPQGSLTN